MTENADGYKAQLELASKMGTPIAQHDGNELSKALEAIVEAEAEAKAKTEAKTTEPEPELVTA
jgi:hypothetical protein